MSIYKFGNFETEFDPTEITFVQKYEAAAERYNTSIQAISKEDKASEVLQAACSVFFEFFDNLFGEMTSEKMFGKNRSVDLCIKAFQLLIGIMNDYGETLKVMQLATSSAPKIKRKR